MKHIPLVVLQSENGGGALVQFDALGSTLGALDKVRSDQGGGGSNPWRQCPVSGAWILLPDVTPWAVLHFVGAAGFGGYPALCYDALLRRLSKECGGGVAIIASPYNVDLNHGSLATDVVVQFDSALAHWAETQGWDEGALKTFTLGHSLGAKLALFNRLSQEHGDGPTNHSPLCLMAFNNFGLADSVTLGLEFVETFSGGLGKGIVGGSPLGGMIGSFASMAVANAGIEFKPSPQEMEALGADASLDDVTFLSFSQDKLDSTAQFLSKHRGDSIGKSILMPGQHLTPIFIQLSVSDLVDSVPEVKGFIPFDGNSFAFGDEPLLADLVQSLYKWMLGIPTQTKPLIFEASVDEGPP
eukprot:CAMPEP_0185754676 /NCGR_PEP_ID=MMETSP1174-20130828/13286_1 /TAXON_ID=35687 /ORGANISM="Dictyocha speculum, Strain CCMP1381" /LENGTH=355 /DNA_ID=CAMNT_0028432981 /DNA_START=83 /DNA_END=1150 /DNA_ORIENTATION=+